MADFTDLFPTFFGIMPWIIYLCIVIQFAGQPDHEKRLKLALVVALFFLLRFVASGVLNSMWSDSQWSFAFLQLMVLSLFALADIPLMIGKYTVLLLFAVFVVASLQGSFWGLLIGFIAYVVIASGFVFSTHRMVTNWAKKGM
ncbi:MAG: hypothetical protein Q7R47_03190 [Candidatus Diapherotrites archaeon]|nr:hypothetical protein [Candidatus Diapherotrites archaeon]